MKEIFLAMALESEVIYQGILILRESSMRAEHAIKRYGLMFKLNLNKSLTK